jgi:hypothetical protein
MKERGIEVFECVFEPVRCARWRNGVVVKPCGDDLMGQPIDVFGVDQVSAGVAGEPLSPCHVPNPTHRMNVFCSDIRNIFYSHNRAIRENMICCGDAKVFGGVVPRHTRKGAKVANWRLGIHAGGPNLAEAVHDLAGILVSRGTFHVS